MKNKKNKSKTRVPSQIVGGGINRKAGVMSSDKDYSRIKETTVDTCVGCNQLEEDCTCCDQELSAIDWDADEMAEILGRKSFDWYEDKEDPEVV